jgi:hypothetical protein
MTERILGPTGRRRRRLFLLGPITVLAALVGLFVSSAAVAVDNANCTTADNLPLSTFEIDAIVPPGPNAKKNELPTKGANLKLDDSDCTDWNSITPITQPDNLTGTGDEAFGQGTSENDPVPTIVTDSIPPNKSDLIRFGIYQENAGNKTFVAVYWARINSPQGTTNMDFEFNKRQCTPNQTPADSDCSANGLTPIRSNGDKLLLYDLSSGGTAVNIHVRTWDGTQWGNEETLSSASALGSINYDLIPDNESGPVLGILDPLTFGEAVIDFNALIGGANCGQFGSVYLKSRSSDSFSSEIKDFVKPKGINLSNCTSLTTQAAGGTIGGTISDTASLSGATNPTGAVTFNVYTDSACTTLATGGGNIAGTALADADNDGVYTSTATYTPTAVGDYYWTASFAGDANNAPASKGCDVVNEKSTVTKRSSSVTTAQVLVPNDSATVADGGAGLALNGTLTFKLFAPNNLTCATGANDPAPVALDGTTQFTLSGNAPQTRTTTNTKNTDVLAGSHANALGAWHWLVTYTGDSLHNDATPSNCIEAFTIDDDVTS